DDHQVHVDSMLILPIHIGDLLNQPIYSAELNISYDPAVLQAQSVSTVGTVCENWGAPAVNLSQSGVITMALAGATALSDSGIFCNVFFDVVGVSGDSCRIRVDDCVLNEGEPAVSTQDGTVRLFGQTDVGSGPSGIPQSFALHQNYPNPFNPETIISYDVPQSIRVQLTVYNTQGREVCIMVDEIKSAGIHQSVFDGKYLSSGVYICRFQAGKKVFIKKMLLLK
ncbi:T9SS type A sorting domain-containing protein, partial [bacterium]|nr:T9SS type A sorting domain-containing protein [bacterium]